MGRFPGALPPATQVVPLRGWGESLGTIPPPLKQPRPSSHPLCGGCLTPDLSGRRSGEGQPSDQSGVFLVLAPRRADGSSHFGN
jgi:hypothetical protein